MSYLLVNLVRFLKFLGQLVLAVWVFLAAAWIYFTILERYSSLGYVAALALLGLLAAFWVLVAAERSGMLLNPKWGVAAAWSLVFFALYSIQQEVERLANIGIVSAQRVVQNAVGCAIPFFGQCGPTSYLDLTAEMDWQLLSASLACILSAIYYVTNSFDRMPGRREATRRVYGTAEWMSQGRAREAFGRGDLIVGQAATDDEASELYRFDGSGHLITIAGSGAGKTTSVAIPNALRWPGNLVVIDPKGEVASLCAEERARAGRNVIIIDPTGEIGPRELHGSLNVLDWIDASSPSVVENVDAVVDWLAPDDTSHGENAVFHEQAKVLVKVIILSVICERVDPLPVHERTLSAVRRRIVDYQRVLDALVKQPENFHYGEQLAQLAASLLSITISERTWSGVMLHASQILAWLSTPSLSPLVSAETGAKRPATGELIGGKMDVFICVPIKTLDATPAVVRLLLGALLNVVYEHGRRRGSFEHRTLFLIDEMPRLKHMKLLETARDASRGLGAVLWAIVQDMGQLERYYQHTGVRSWMESCSVRSFFGISDVTTAEYVSKSLGTKTEEIEETSTARSIASALRSAWGLPSRSSTVTRRVVSRPLLTPGEVMQLGVNAQGNPAEQIVFRRNTPPLRCGIVRWFERPEFRDIRRDD